MCVCVCLYLGAKSAFITGLSLEFKILPVSFAQIIKCSCEMIFPQNLKTKSLKEKVTLRRHKKRSMCNDSQAAWEIHSPVIHSLWIKTKGLFEITLCQIVCFTHFWVFFICLEWKQLWEKWQTKKNKQTNNNKKKEKTFGIPKYSLNKLPDQA